MDLVVQHFRTRAHRIYRKNVFAAGDVRAMVFGRPRKDIPCGFVRMYNEILPL